MQRNIFRVLNLVIMSSSEDLIPLVRKLLVIDLMLIFNDKVCEQYCEHVHLMSNDSMKYTLDI